MFFCPKPGVREGPVQVGEPQNLETQDFPTPWSASGGWRNSGQSCVPKGVDGVSGGDVQHLQASDRGLVEAARCQ